MAGGSIYHSGDVTVSTVVIDTVIAEKVKKSTKTEHEASFYAYIAEEVVVLDVFSAHDEEEINARVHKYTSCGNVEEVTKNLKHATLYYPEIFRIEYVPSELERVALPHDEDGDTPAHLID